jgi:hypothetical protein
MVNYKFNEGALIQELQQYVDSTYNQHYSKNNFQATEFIIDSGHGMGFALGNVLKYAQRYGNKDGTNRKDLMKILHYALIALHQHDLNNKIDVDLDDILTTVSGYDPDRYIDNMGSMDYNITYEGNTISLDDTTLPEWDTLWKNLNRKKNQ